MDLRTGRVVQFAASALATATLAFWLEEMRVEWTGEFVFALSWLVFALSIGAVSLRYILIRRGPAARVASLFFLVPPCTAVIAWLLFGETLGALAKPAWS
jgi:drug/metabolite transporter (DMT)-like permease